MKISIYLLTIFFLEIFFRNFFIRCQVNKSFKVYFYIIHLTAISIRKTATQSAENRP